MRTATVLTKEWKVVPDDIVVTQPDEQIQWEIYGDGWEFPEKEQDVIKINNGHNGTSSAREFRSPVFDPHPSGKRRFFSLTCKHSKKDKFKYTLFMVDAQGNRKPLDPSITNDGEFFLKGLKPILIFLIGLLFGGFGVKFLGM